MASGNTLCSFYPASGSPPSSNYATLNIRNGHLVLEFDDTTSESMTWEAVLPRNYAGGGVTVTIFWLGKTATTGDVVWRAYFERHQAETDDLDSDSYASAQTTTTTTAGTSGQIKLTAITFTDGAQMDSVGAGEHFRFKVDRNAGAGGDTMTGDAQIVGIEIRET